MNNFFSPDGKIRPLVDHFNRVAGYFYTPDKNVCVDESLVGTRGRTAMLQYIPSKAAKFGVKFWVLAESASGYVHNIKCYLGKKFSPVTQLQQGTDVVLDLMRRSNLLNKGYHIICDSFFCSLDLAKRLLNLNTYITGTLRANRQMPLTIKNANIDVNETVYVRQGNILATAYKGRNGRKPVRMLSTYAHAASLNGKPAIIELYNKNMGGVDGADQLIHFYNDNRKSIKVWKKLAINLIHRMCNNAYILYKKNTCHMPIKSRLRFVQDVVEGLATEHLAAREDREGHVGRAIQPRRVVAIVRQIAGKTIVCQVAL